MTNQQKEQPPPPTTFGQCFGALDFDDQGEALKEILVCVETFVEDALEAQWKALGVGEGTDEEFWLFATRIKTPEMWLTQQAHFPKDFAHQLSRFERLKEKFAPGTVGPPWEMAP